MAEQLDIFGAKAARDAGMATVEANAGDWFPAALAYIQGLVHWRGTGEDLRMLITPVLGPPHHRNVWGALVSQAVRRRLLIRTGERVRMYTEKSHARTTDVYVRHG
jgi:hypothetical protein